MPSVAVGALGCYAITSQSACLVPPLGHLVTQALSNLTLDPMVQTRQNLTYGDFLRCQVRVWGRHVIVARSACLALQLGRLITEAHFDQTLDLATQT